MSKYEAIIGMEVHVEANTKSKMFCSCKNNKGLDEIPNIHICPVCTAHPGTLPVPNKQALVQIAKFGNALNCKLEEYTWFERKSYFYPDLPKGYQITQYEKPMCYDGNITIDTSKGEKSIRITRIHMEEDTGKLTHIAGDSNSYVDYNRAGIPLMELVTEPDIRDGEEARIFCEELQLILQHLDISDADMSKGQMRCEVNVSLREVGTEKFGTKVEIKNLNSFKVVENCINYEIKRQTTLLENGEEIIQETRGWDDNRSETFSQRKKENAKDYRYFMEPDIPPFYTKEIIMEANKDIRELPSSKRKRFIQEYNLSKQQAETITKDKSLANYYENVISELLEWFRVNNLNIKDPLQDEKYLKLVKLATNYLLTELIRMNTEYRADFIEPRITPENYAEFIIIIGSGKISSSAGQTVLEEMFVKGSDPSDIIEEKGLKQVNDTNSLQIIVDKIIIENPKVVDDYKSGNQNSVQYLVGQVMKESKGSANPQIARELLEKTLNLE